MFSSTRSVNRNRTPVVKVHLESNPKTKFSVTVPDSKDWAEFLNKCASKLNFDVRRVFNVSQALKDGSTSDLSELDNMQKIKHGSILCLKLSDENSSDESSSEPEVVEKVDEKHRQRFDVFLRTNHLRPKIQKMRNRLGKRIKRLDWAPVRGQNENNMLVFSNEKGQRLELRNELFNEVPTSLKLTDLQNLRIAVILCHGGRFAGGIFEGPNEICHKTFSRYVVRKKQGGRQAARGAHSTSAGSWLRNFHEKKLHEDIVNLFKAWGPELDQCERIFIHSPGTINHKTVFAEESYFNVSDPRIAKVSINTKAPKYNEVKRVHHYLAQGSFFDKQRSSATPSDEM